MLTEAAKNSTLSASGYYPDIVMENKDSVGYFARQEMAQNGHVEVANRIPLDIASQDKVLPNYLDMRLTIFLNDPQFLIDTLEIKKNKLRR